MRYVVVIILVTLLANMFESIMDNRLAKSVTDGDAILTCHIGEFPEVIEPEKVVSLINGVWLFTNGSAKNCQVKPNEAK